MIWSMLPDMLKYREWRSENRERVNPFGTNLFELKAIPGIGVEMLGLALKVINYRR